MVRAVATLGLLLAQDLTGAGSEFRAGDGDEARARSASTNQPGGATGRRSLALVVNEGAGSCRSSVDSTSYPVTWKGDPERLVQAIGACREIDPVLLRVIIHRESSGNPFAISVENTQGLMQLLPSTAKRFGARNPLDPAQNIDAGARYLRFLLDRYGNRLSVALAAYNAGEAAVDRHGGIPPYTETRRFVSRTLAAYGEQGGPVAPEDWVRSSVPLKSGPADQECVRLGLPSRRMLGREWRHE